MDQNTLEFLKILVPTVASVAAGYFSLMAARHASAVRSDVGKIEKATNDMKDQLVQKTAEAAEMKGIAKGVAAVVSTVSTPVIAPVNKEEVKKDG